MSGFRLNTNHLIVRRAELRSIEQHLVLANVSALVLEVNCALSKLDSICRLTGHYTWEFELNLKVTESRNTVINLRQILSLSLGRSLGDIDLSYNLTSVVTLTSVCEGVITSIDHLSRLNNFVVLVSLKRHTLIGQSDSRLLIGHVVCQLSIEFREHLLVELSRIDSDSNGSGRTFVVTNTSVCEGVLTNVDQILNNEILTSLGDSECVVLILNKSNLTVLNAQVSRHEVCAIVSLSSILECENSLPRLRSNLTSQRCSSHVVVVVVTLNHEPNGILTGIDLCRNILCPVSRILSRSGLALSEQDSSDRSILILSDNLTGSYDFLFLTVEYEVVNSYRSLVVRSHDVSLVDGNRTNGHEGNLIVLNFLILPSEVKFLQLVNLSVDEVVLLCSRQSECEWNIVNVVTQQAVDDISLLNLISRNLQAIPILLQGIGQCNLQLSLVDCNRNSLYCSIVVVAVRSELGVNHIVTSVEASRNVNIPRTFL